MLQRRRLHGGSTARSDDARCISVRWRIHPWQIGDDVLCPIPLTESQKGWACGKQCGNSVKPVSSYRPIGCLRKPVGCGGIDPIGKPVQQLSPWFPGNVFCILLLSHAEQWGLRRSTPRRPATTAILRHGCCDGCWHRSKPVRTRRYRRRRMPTRHHGALFVHPQPACSSPPARRGRLDPSAATVQNHSSRHGRPFSAPHIYRSPQVIDACTYMYILFSLPFIVDQDPMISFFDGLDASSSTVIQIILIYLI